MLKYTGHPLIDVGVATIVAFARKGNPAEVTEGDLHAFADYLEPYLLTKTPATMYLNFNYNSMPFTNPSQQGPQYAEVKQEYANKVLRSFMPTDEQGMCSFCGQQAVHTAARGKVPLLNGVDVINFSPRGCPGMPICGYCQLAIHAAPMGSIKCQGWLLAVHADQPGWTLLFARRSLERNQKILHMMDMGSVEEWPSLNYPKTRLVEALVEIQSQSQRQRANSVVAYHFTNYGPTPGINIYELPSSVVDFVREVDRPDAAGKSAWDHYVRVGWVQPKKKKGELEEGDTSAEGSAWRNTLYEGLFDLPEGATKFILAHLLPPARNFEAWCDPPSGNWELLTLFFRKVMHMDKQRIEAIRNLGDRLAGYIHHRDRRLFNDLHFARNYGTLRLVLIRAARDGWSPDGEPLLPMDTYVTVFEEGETDFADISWRLARDVLMIRICEQLQKSGWFASNQDVLEEIKQKEAEQTSEG